MEALGYSTLFMPDHFGDQLAPMPALMAAAEPRRRCNVGALVFDNDYKHPVVLAKEMATIDVLSGGRVELGIGAGWMTTDYEQSGIPYDRAGVRIDRMVEGIAVMKGCFGRRRRSTSRASTTRSPTTTGCPSRVQQPHPPILIGGGGQRCSASPAREADIVGINPNLHAGAVGADAAARRASASADRKIAWIREGRRRPVRRPRAEDPLLLAAITDDRETSPRRSRPCSASQPTRCSRPARAGRHRRRDLRHLRASRALGRLATSWSATTDGALAPVVARLAGT